MMLAPLRTNIYFTAVLLVVVKSFIAAADMEDTGDLKQNTQSGDKLGKSQARNGGGMDDLQPLWGMLYADDTDIV